MKKNKVKFKRHTLPKSPTSIQGLDEITGGGLPKGRPTLVCGGAGCGKTLLAMEFLVRGATEHNEPGVFISFEETEKELTANVASLGFDLKSLIAKKKIWLENIIVEPDHIEESGEFNLEGLFVRIHHAVESINAKRVVLDTIETLFSGLPNMSVLRNELRRLLRWLKNKGVTTILTGERGEASLTRHGLEEYVSDCVILLDHRVSHQSSIRRLRVVKYRGSVHGTNEYPFLIDEDGFSLLPVTSINLNSVSSNERISTGIPRLDTMLSGKGYFRGSTVLVSGTAGTGKTSVAAKFMEAACKRGETVLYFAFEESPNQFMRNMHSIGIHLEKYVRSNHLHFHATRPTLHGLEHHLSTAIKLINKIKPEVVVVDPIDAFMMGDNHTEVKTMLLRLVDFLKARQITAFFASLTSEGDHQELSDSAISSLIDTWLLLRDIEIGGERNRELYVLKSRGMAHSNQIREFTLSDNGIELLDVYVGPDGVLTGSARLSQEARDRAEQVTYEQEINRQHLGLERKRTALEARITDLRAEFEGEESETNKIINIEKARTRRYTQDQSKMAKSRKADKVTKPVPDNAKKIKKSSYKI
jgi:circadian clock protein KaiC